MAKITKTRTFRVVNPTTEQPRRPEGIPWKLILITGAVSSLGALVIGDLYRAAKTRVLNVTMPPQPLQPQQHPGQLYGPPANNPPTRWGPPGSRRENDEYEYDYDDYEEDVEVNSMWDPAELEERARKLNRKEKELQAREAEIADRARKLRLIS